MSETTEKLIGALERWLDTRDDYNSGDGNVPWDDVEHCKDALARALDEFLSYTPILPESERET